jgi:hypothetical protein
MAHMCVYVYMCVFIYYRKIFPKYHIDGTCVCIYIYIYVCVFIYCICTYTVICVSVCVHTPMYMRIDNMSGQIFVLCVRKFIFRHI